MPLDGTPDSDGTVRETVCSTLTLPIIPVRFAVVPNSRTTKYKDLSCEGTLSTPLTTFDNAKYTLRTLRPGYVYIFNGKKMLLWEADGKNKFSSLKFPDQQNYNQPDNYGDTLNSVWAHENVDEVWIGYFPSLLTTEGVNRLIGDSGLRNKMMRNIKIAELKDGENKPSGQQNTLPIETLPELVEEFKPNGSRLDWSGSNLEPQLGYHALSTKLNAIYPKARPKVPLVVALDDPEGVAMDLGLIANYFSHQLLDVQGQIAQLDSVMQCNDVPADVSLDTSYVCELTEEYQRKEASFGMIESSLLANVKTDGQYRGKDVFERWELFKNDSSLDRYIDKIDSTKVKKFLSEKKRINNNINKIKNNVRIACNDHARMLETGEYYKVDNAGSLAALWDMFERGNLLSAFALEHSIACSIEGMGDAPLGQASGDRRIKLRDSWASDPKSPIYLGLNAYKPIADKKDSLGDIADGSGALIGKIYHRYPYTLATETITTVTTSWLLKRVKGQQRWIYSKSLVEAFENAKKLGDTKHFIEALEKRYEIAKNMETEVGKKVGGKIRLYLDRTNEILNTSTHSSVSANREGLKELLVVKNHALSKKPNPLVRSSTLSSLSGSVVNKGVAICMLWNLSSAIHALRTQTTVESSCNLISAMAGAAGIISDGARFAISQAQRKIPRTYVVGRSAIARLNILVLSKTVARRFGFIGAAFDGITSAVAGYNAYQKSDNDAGGFFIGAGLSLATGGALLSYGLAALTVPGIGWVIAAGVLLVGFGMWLSAKANAALDTPLELWLNASSFGDNFKKVSKPFATLEEEMTEHFLLCYTPRDVGSEWGSWFGDDVKYKIFLPRCDFSVSECVLELQAFREDDVRANRDADKCRVYKTENNPDIAEKIDEQGGVTLHVKHDWKDGEVNSSRLKVRYTPDKFTYPQSVLINFYVDD